MSEEKLRGLPIPEECNELNRISWLNYLENIDEFDLDWIRESEVFKALMPKLNLKENTVILTSTPNGEKGFFYDMWNKQNE